MTLTFNQLDQSLKDAIGNCPDHFNELLELMQLLLITGIRPNEALLHDRWIYYSDALITLQPLKGNNIRQFRSIDLPPQFVNSIQTNYKYFQEYNYSMFRRQFERVYSFPNAYIKNKQSGLYLFRHRYIKDLHQQGKSIAEIKSITGHVSDGAIYEYIFSDIVV